jgi:hypothetical protein
MFNQINPYWSQIVDQIRVQGDDDQLCVLCAEPAIGVLVGTGDNKFCAECSKMSHYEILSLLYQNRIAGLLVGVNQNLEQLMICVVHPEMVAMPGVCRQCGCTHETPCPTPGKRLPFCFWIDETQTKCSKCFPTPQDVAVETGDKEAEPASRSGEGYPFSKGAI